MKAQIRAQSELLFMPVFKYTLAHIWGCPDKLVHTHIDTDSSDLFIFPRLVVASPIINIPHLSGTFVFLQLMNLQ